jgi:hypothetical protein
MTVVHTCLSCSYDVVTHSDNRIRLSCFVAIPLFMPYSILDEVPKGLQQIIDEL